MMINSVTASLNRIFANNKAVPALNLQKYSKLSQDTYRVICAVDSYNYEEQAYSEAISNITGNKFILVEGTVQSIGTESQNFVSMIVASNTPVLQYDEVKNRKMSVVTANVFADTSDNIWKVVGEGDDRMLVQVSEVNYEEILAARKNKNIITASVGIEVGADFDNGSYITYFNTDNYSVSAGFGLLTEKGPAVYDRELYKLVPIKEEQVLQVVDQLPEIACQKELDVEDFYNQLHRYTSVTASLPSEAIKKHLEYMKILYGKHPFYFNKLEKLIKQKAKLGDKGYNEEENIGGGNTAEPVPGVQ